MGISKQEFHAKLPARITGLVFWGLVFIGLFAAVVVLNNAGTNLSKHNKNSVMYLSHEIETVLEKHYEIPISEATSGRIRHAITSLRNELDFSAVAINVKDYGITIGVIQPEYTFYETTVQFYPQFARELHEVFVRVYFPDETIAVSDLRKNILLIVGISVFAFGILLQRILNQLLSKPFLDMVDVAEHITDGDFSVRFNENRSDEFGYLGGFINAAINKLFRQQDELNDALKLIEKSEEELKTEKERAEVTLTSITDAVVTVDINGIIQFINPSAVQLLGVKAKEVENHAFYDVVHLTNELTGEPLTDVLEACFQSGEAYDLPEHSSLVNSESVAIAIQASVAAMKGDTGQMIGAVMVIQDVSHTRKLTRQLSYQASYDMLTGLYNRRKFEELLSAALLGVSEDNKTHTFCYLDLDQFKIVNDTCGHIAGDELLRQIPEIFHLVLRSGDIVARLGGDEFGILLEHCQVGQAIQIADKIRQKIKDYRFNWDDKVFEIGVSIGIVGVTKDNADLTTLMSSADVACYAAKDAGRNRVHVYEASDDATALRHGEMHWTGRIQHALVNNRFVLYMQPIVNIAGSSEEHYEILLRMLNDSGEIIPPGAFMPAAERYNLMNNIDRWVISAAFRYIADYDHSNRIMGTNKVISINLSGDSVNDKTMLAFIKRERDATGIDFENVCFEITETIAISNLSKASEFMNALKEYGCQFALDDFGSGLSSFAYLKTLPVDFLKIDGSFVKDVSRDEIDRAMVASIQKIGEIMSLKTVAEKVEDEETLVILKEIGIDFVQGFHLGRPEPIYVN